MSLRSSSTFFGAVLLTITIFSGSGHAQDVSPTLHAPTGLVSVNLWPKAREIMELFVGPKMVLVDGFVTVEDARLMTTGQVPEGNRYIIVSQYADPAMRKISTDQFSHWVVRSRSARHVGKPDEVNALLKKRLANSSPEYKTLQMGSVADLSIVVDAPNCFAMSTSVNSANQSNHVRVLTVTSWQRVEGQFFQIATYAHDTTEDARWLSVEGMAWLKSVCHA